MKKALKTKILIFYCIDTQNNIISILDEYLLQASSKGLSLNTRLFK